MHLTQVMGHPVECHTVGVGSRRPLAFSGDTTSNSIRWFAVICRFVLCLFHIKHIPTQIANKTITSVVINVMDDHSTIKEIAINSIFDTARKYIGCVKKDGQAF
jgi:hypothetical protein